MAIGWIRDYMGENSVVGSKIPYYERAGRADYRASFKTALRSSPSDGASQLKALKWGDVVDLPNGIGDGDWVEADSAGIAGFVQRRHAVEVGFVAKGSGNSSSALVASLTYDAFDPETQKLETKSRDVLWGDLVQILTRGPQRCEVRVRGMHGKMDTGDIDPSALLEVYFIDVGQGDGTLVRTPQGRHLLIDGGLEREKQQTGKNAIDFIDWKFFFDYGDHRIRLESLMASHSDTDHFGGLHDLVRLSSLAERELDCTGADIGAFHHPGLSRWTNEAGANPAHADGLGPKLGDGFIRLLGDRADAESAVSGGANGKLSGPWRYFIEDLLDYSQTVTVEQVSVERDALGAGGALKRLWDADGDCVINVLAPVTYREGAHTALPDLGNKGKNTNGHSICLRIDHGGARILLTGDLNSKSMNWLEECYGDLLSAWRCDVAKACHHGSDDVSYRFLEAINAAATIISSGDSEGYAHPRPDIVSASANSGYKYVDRARDRLVTPLVYMTEIERSIILGAVNRIDVRNMPTADGEADGVVLGRPVDEIDAMGFLSPEARKRLRGLDKAAEKKAIRDNEKAEKPGLKAAEAATESGRIRVDMNLTVPLGPVDKKNETRRTWRARMMQKTHYGLVNIRTDGDTIMCATLNETEDKWIVHRFPARFGNA